MKVFKLHQRLFTLLWIKSSDNSKPHTKILNLIFTLIAFASQFLCFISSTVYITEFIANDLENALFAVFEMVATASGLYTLIIVLTIREAIVDVLEKFQKFCDASKSGI